MVIVTQGVVPESAAPAWQRQWSGFARQARCEGLPKQAIARSRLANLIKLSETP